MNTKPGRLNKWSALSMSLIAIVVFAGACGAAVTPVPATSAPAPTQSPAATETPAPTEAPTAEVQPTVVSPLATPTEAEPTVVSPLPTGTSAPVPTLVSPVATGTTTTTQSSYADPFAYCAAVGTIDKADARYTGPKTPPAVVNGLQKALNLPGTPAPPVAQNSFWRCMDGKVYACTVGANLPCEQKANTSKTPTEGMVTFCKDQPNSDIIPAFAAGHDTIYDWRCTNGTPEVVKQIAQVDAQGYLANIWYQIQP